MGELSVRRNRELAVPRYQKTGKAEKQAGAGQTRQAAGREAATVSETLRQLMDRISQAERQAREGRRTLRSGEAALAEVDDRLSGMEELAREAAGDGAPDRDALQESLERLCGEIERIARDGAEAGLFQDGDSVDDVDGLADAVMDGLSARQEGVQSLPAWLLRGMDSAPGRAALLAALGVGGSAGGPELLAALGRLPLEDSPGAGYLAALYLGAVISGGTPSGAVDPAQAAEGLRQLLEMVDKGVTPDEALELLTGGAFTSLEDFQAQFTGGTAPGLEPFLIDLLLSGDEPLSMSPMLALMTGGEGDLELLMGLLAALEGSGDGLMALLDGTGAPEGAALQQEAPEPGAVLPLETEELGTVQAAGRDLSGASFDPAADTLTAGGAEDLTLRGQGQEAPAIRLTGSGTVTLQQVSAPLLSAESAQARVVTAGESVLAQVRLGEGTTLTIDGGGLVRVGELRGGAHSVLRLTGGAVVLDGNAAGAQGVSVVVDGAVSLLAAEGTAVQDAQGRSLEPFDIVWKTLLPEWGEITALAVDGREGQLALMRGEQFDPVRLWLLKGEGEERWPAHTVMLRGRDRMGQPRTRYIYVRWDERAGGFQETSMYPNPFTVTGGEPETDWRYEEESQTLHILSGQVSAIAGGAGTDGSQLPFSGRIALADGIGRAELTLEGVVCKVSSGRAFYLGRGNGVTLLLRRGTDNVFQSGPGRAGISMGDGTSLDIDQTEEPRGEPDGTLTATGGAGGAGIGRDNGAAEGPVNPIVIRGGVVVAAGTDIGGAKLWSQKGLSIQMGEAAVTLPKFRVSARTLRLDGLDLSTREAARAAMAVIAADRRWIARLQGAYGAMYGQLAQSFGGLYSVRQYFSVVRDTDEASSLANDIREVLRQSPLAAFLRQRGMEDVGQLLR